MPVYIAGGPLDALLDKALDRQKAAYRPGTQKNRNSAVNSLISFAVDMGFQYGNPSPEQLCAYIETLVLRPMTPNGIRGHISNLKAFFRNAGFSTRQFKSIQVTNALRAIAITVKHNPKVKHALEPNIIAQIVQVIDTYPQGHMVSFSVALMFTGFLRQSNLLPSSVKAFDPDRQVTCADVKLTNDLLTLDIKWSKTNQRFGESTILTISPMPNSPICPLSRYKRTQPRASRLSTLPLIRFNDGNPIPIAFVNKYWKTAISAIGIQCKNITLHRLRLSGASWANENGVASLDICQHGSWSSDAYRSYVAQSKSKPNKVNHCMSKISH